MKIQCDVCERAEATVLCCADEAALCWGCDEKVHAANKLAGKHQRVPLLSCSSSNPSSNSFPSPTCDICQEKTGYFFCLEDRALLCRHCDVSIHSASPFVSSHQRFLITGVRVALQHYLANNSSNISSSSNNVSSNSSSSNGNIIRSNSLASNSSPANKKQKMSLMNLAGDEVDGLRSQWPWSEILKTTGMDQCYGFPEPGASN
ncbi:B-box-type zinc finger domain-containing protein [Dioscorea alata]|uniref:B-box-type zinc finger domain-containing protein n=2 Tax=Dioscorea alata TaxID=55571 RepID=A0ACB7VAN3_DIOAL|nr:B-box-type zinc finger domain-containing protein [Dioscorea alata]KAH7670834.1 B-box-type zinc finger domain-containing protein [Dioscorea alata]